MITSNHEKWVEDTLASMTVEQRLCQLLCPKIEVGETPQAFAERLRPYPVGSIFILPRPLDEVREVVETVAPMLPVAPAVAMDLIWGPAHGLHQGGTDFCTAMAAAAAGSKEWIHDLGRAIAREARACGVNWTLGPEADISLNPDSPIVNFRAFSDDPEEVANCAEAFVRGVEDTGLMAATPKHFPGDGVDDRDQHFLTSINSLDREEWEATFGRVYRQLIASGCKAIMTGHIGLPFMDPGDSWLGCPPATLSSRIQVDLLRKELGFEGVIVSDAVRMTGLLAHVDKEDIAWRLIAAGCDVVLFSFPEIEFPRMLQACQKGDLSMERVDDAVRRVLRMKASLGLVEGPLVVPLADEARQQNQETAREMAEHSVSIVRDVNGILPLQLKSGAKVLTVTLQYARNDPKFTRIDCLTEELARRGFQVDNIEAPSREELWDLAGQYDAVFININIGSHSRAGVIRMTKETLGAVESLCWKRNPNTVITSFGDPYKIREMPYVPVMVNTFSPTRPSVAAAVKVWLGEIPALGRSPVGLEGFFNRDPFK